VLGRPASIRSLSMPRLAGFSSILAALRNPNYGLYTAGSGISLIGTWMQRVATGWLTWELTGSGAWLGLVAFADLFPTVIIGPIAGAIADRWDRLTVTRISQSLAMLQAITLFTLTVTGLINIYLLLALVAFLGSVAAFNQPARLALIPSLVPREHLMAAVAVNSIVFNLARFIGPAAAGVAIVSGGVALAFLLNAVSFAFFLLALARIRLGPPEARTAKRNFFADLADGFRYAVSHAGIAPMLLLLIVTSVGVRPVIELMAGFADRVFAAGAPGLAMLTSAVGVGAVVGGIWLAGRAEPAGLTRVVLTATLVLVATTLVFAATDALWLGVAAMLVLGFAMVCAGVGTQTLIQLSVDSAMRGRVLSLYGLIFRGAPALGALMMGVASEAVGLRWPLAAGALFVLAAALWARAREGRIVAALEAPPPQGTEAVTHR
jgi:predicted MFS family arabinose efflux permease